MHCRASHDCNYWAREPRRSLKDREHSDWVHAERDACLTQLWAWIDATIVAIRRQASLATVGLPNPWNPDTSLPVGMVDPSTVLIVLAIAQRFGQEAAGIYVGVVGQDPNCMWRGLTGFFVPWCPGCDKDGDQTLRYLERTLQKRGVVMASVWDLPVAIQPQEGWFDGDRLMLGGRVHILHGVADYWRRVDAELREPALVATGPVATSLSNLVLLDADPLLLADFRPHPTRWTIRQGEAAPLSALAGISSLPAQLHRGQRPPSRLPTAWGSFCDHSGIWHGPFPNLRRAASTWAASQPEPGASLSIVYLPKGCAVRLSDVLRLKSTSKG